MSPAAILLVEDETVVAHDIRLQLQDMGYQVAAEARTGEDAIALAEQLHPDLVLMDIQLGSAMDGIAAAQVIRAQQRLPIVFLSAFAADEMLSRAMLVEPYVQDLVQRLKERIERSLSDTRRNSGIRDAA